MRAWLVLILTVFVMCFVFAEGQDFIFQNEDFVLRVTITDVFGYGHALRLEFIPRKSMEFVPFLSTFTDNDGKESPLVIKDAYYGYLSSKSFTVYSVETKDLAFDKQFIVIPLSHLHVTPESYGASISYLPIGANPPDRKLKIAYVADKKLKFFECTIVTGK